MEAYNLFKQMLANMNKDVVSFLFKGEIPTQQAGEVRAARPAPKPAAEAQVRASKPELAGATSSRNVSSSGFGGYGDPSQMSDTREVQKTQPVRVDQRIGRNDPCPCGSGKKFKNCHG